MPWDQTRPSLLLRIRNAGDRDAWAEFAAIYSPVVRAYARRSGVPAQELDDLLQEVLWAVHQLIERFEHDPARRQFRPWLRSVTHRRILKWRSGLRKAPIQPEDSQILTSATADDEQLEQYWERQWSAHLMGRATQIVRRDIGPRTFEAFHRYAVLEEPPGEVAEALGMSVSNVYSCKRRVLQRLRDEVAALDG